MDSDLYHIQVPNLSIRDAGDESFSSMSVEMLVVAVRSQRRHSGSILTGSDVQSDVSQVYDRGAVV